MCELVPSLPPPAPPPPPPSSSQSCPPSVVGQQSGIMCSSGPQSSAALVSAAAYHGLKVPSPAAAPSFVFHPSMTQAAFDFHRAQLYDYNARLHFGLRAAGYPGAAGSAALAAYAPHGPHDPLAHYYQTKYDPRARFVHEEPKPSHSYIGLIAMAILASKEMKLVLADIYQWILDNYVYFRNRGPGWRNSIRHNLSLNDCFIKAGRSANGKGHYWAIHPANVEDFKKGDFRRRKAQRKVRRHMGLSVPDDEDSPSPPPPANNDAADWTSKVLGGEQQQDGQHSHQPRSAETTATQNNNPLPSPPATGGATTICAGGALVVAGRIEGTPRVPIQGKKRLFDVESLLAPETTTTSDYCRTSIYDHRPPAAKMQKTTIVIAPEADSPPRPTDMHDADADDENIDVEDVGEAEEDALSVSGSRVASEGQGGREDDGVRSVHRASPYSISASPSARLPGADSPTSPGAARRGEDGRPDSRHSQVASPAHSVSPPAARSPLSPVVTDAIRMPGSMSMTLHPHAHPAARGPWGAAPGAGLVGAGWRGDGHPSAFHSTAAGGVGPTAGGVTSLTAWGGVAPHAFPLMSAAFPAPAGSSPAEALAAQQRWQETFSRMMARPMDHTKNNNNVKSEA